MNVFFEMLQLWDSDRNAKLETALSNSNCGPVCIPCQLKVGVLWYIDETPNYTPLFTISASSPPSTGVFECWLVGYKMVIAAQVFHKNCWKLYMTYTIPTKWCKAGGWVSTGRPAVMETYGVQITWLINITSCW